MPIICSYGRCYHITKKTYPRYCQRGKDNRVPKVRAYYLWRIRKASYLYTTLDRELSFGLTTNPQSFVYAKYKAAPEGAYVR